MWQSCCAAIPTPLMSTKIGSLFFIVYVVVVTAAGLLLVEVVSRKINLANGVDIPLLYFQAVVPQNPAVRGEPKSVIDPHRGFARGKSEPRVRELQEKYVWQDGFAVYSKKPLAKLDRPIILTMGGSTTDAARGNDSWPEELSKLLAKRGISATVVNGGTSGYSTNQELLKLLRDGLQFKPDIIISYSGVNDRSAYSKMPFPMVHPYQRYLLEVLTAPQYSPLLPNAVYLMNKTMAGKPPRRVESTFGLPNGKTLGQHYEKNMVLMDAIARASGATFYGIIQPNAYVGSGGEIKTPGDLRKAKPEEYVTQLQELYGQIADLPSQHLFVHSFLSILDSEGLYKKDGIHTTLKGNQAIAESVLSLINPELTRQTSGRASEPEQR